MMRTEHIAREMRQVVKNDHFTPLAQSNKFVHNYHVVFSGTIYDTSDNNSRPILWPGIQYVDTR